MILLPSFYCQILFVRLYLKNLSSFQILIVDIWDALAYWYFIWTKLSLVSLIHLLKFVKFLYFVYPLIVFQNSMYFCPSGDRCKVCADGYYGDATVGLASDCVACPCYAPRVVNSTCVLVEGRPVCQFCAEGYIGEECDV